MRWNLRMQLKHFEIGEHVSTNGVVTNNLLLTRPYHEGDDDDDLESPNLKSSTAQHVFFQVLADDFHNATAI